MKHSMDMLNENDESVAIESTGMTRTSNIHIAQLPNNTQGINTLVRTIKQMNQEAWIREAESKNSRRSLPQR